jgi:septum formation protein
MYLLPFSGVRIGRRSFIFFTARLLKPSAATQRAHGAPPALILASASPRRRELLGSLGVPFEVVVADVTEHEEASTDPRVMVAHNAALKADWVAVRHPDAYVLGADTTVFIDGHALNKPADLDAARAMLRRLSGRTHTVFTGLAFRRSCEGLRIDDGVASDVTFKPLDDQAIETYLSRVHVLDKAGAYAIQEHGDIIVARFAGSWSNIVGLPLETTKQILTRCGLLGFTSPDQLRPT